MISSEELGEDTGQELDLARASDELVVDHRARVDIVLNALEQERVLADLAQLHKLVAETLDTTRFALALKSVSATTVTGLRTYPFESVPSAIILYFFICL